MVDHWLNELADIPGVQQVCVATGRGNILHQKGKEIKKDSLEEIILRILRIIAIFTESNQNVNEIEIFWEKYLIECKTSNNVLIIVFSEIPALLPYLRMSLKVVFIAVINEYNTKIFRFAKCDLY